ncbi:Peptidyl-prolyl cis-trans isomerase e, partial [Globisporangium splendens]
MAAAMDKKNKRTLYVGGLEKQVTEQMLYAAFVPFGPLKGVQVPMDYATQSSKGFGFVEYEDPADAQEAMDNMDVWAETDEAKDTITPDEPEQQQPTVSSRVSSKA